MIKYLACTAAGVAAGYYIAQRRLQDNYHLLLTKAEQDAREFYRLRYERKRQEEFVGSEDFKNSAAEAASALASYQGEPLDSVEVETGDDDNIPLKNYSSVDTAQLEVYEGDVETPILRGYSSSDAENAKKYREARKNVDTVSAITIPASGGPVNYQAISSPPKEEKPETEVQKPEIITPEEFVSSQTGYAQVTVMYFAGDDTLAGEEYDVLGLETRNVTIGNEVMEMLKAGPEAMGDADAAYIRNHEKRVELEIVRDEGSYTEKVGPIDNTG